MEHHNKVGFMVTMVLWWEEEWMVGRENGDDVGFKTPLSSHHIGIGTKL
jgi:hypothetical protein